MAKSPISSPLKESDKEVTANVLQSTLVDLIDLSLVAKQAHWNVVGPNFRSVHLQLDELVSAARTDPASGEGRASDIGVSPQGKATSARGAAGLTEYPDRGQDTKATVDAIVAILAEMIERLRKSNDETDKGDLVTQDLLIEIA